jgi:hypothetical protein
VFSVFVVGGGERGHVILETGAEHSITSTLLLAFILPPAAYLDVSKRTLSCRPSSFSLLSFYHVDSFYLILLLFIYEVPNPEVLSCSLSY